jgi:hypothetical protein
MVLIELLSPASGTRVRARLRAYFRLPSVQH